VVGKRHPNKEIQQALNHAEALGWQIEPASGHAWARLYCPFNDMNCRYGKFCVVSVWSTPKSPVDHARQIRRVVDKCARRGDEPKGG
jgi:hypothetical protein